MANQIVVSAGAKVRNLDGVLTATSGVVSSVPLGAANGVATLDSGGKVPVSQLPSSVVTYLGTWNAATNTPTLVNGTGDAGDMYICNVAGTVNFGAGPITFAVGDWVLYGSGTWQKSNGQNGTVTSVAASITGSAIGITGSPITTAGTLAFAFSGTSGQYVNGAGNLTTFPTLITSIGLSMPSAFSVANSPLTANGTIAVTGAGTTAQYIRGDGSLATFPTIATEAQRLITEVYNETGATLTKGTVVYINGGHGNLPTVTKAIATGDATSAQTYGIVQTDITNMNNGYVVVIGSLGDLDTQAYANGTQLYLSSTVAGQWTSVKQYAPAHLVYVAIVTRSHPTQGVVEVRIQNGFEMDELHNVSAQSPLNNQGLFYNTSTSLWENKSIATALGYTPANDASVVHLTGNETIAGIKTFSNEIKSDGSILLKNGIQSVLSGYVNIGGNAFGRGIDITFPDSGGSPLTNTLNFNPTTAYSYTFPAATGTLALTSNLANYVDLTTAQTIGGTKTFSDATKNNGGIFLQNASSNSLAGYMNIGGLTNGVKFTSGGGVSNSFTLPSATGYTFTFPNGTGTIALTSDLTGGTVTSVAALTIGTSGTDLSSTVANSTTTPVITLNVPTASATNRGVLSSADWTTFNNKQSALTNPVLASGTWTSGYLPKINGTYTIGNSIIQDLGYAYILPSGAEALRVANDNVFLSFYNSSNTTRRGYIQAQSTALTIAAEGSFMQFQTPSGSMRLDASGNLGLGVTPSAWSAITALELANGVSIASYSAAAIPNSYLTNNAFYNGSNWIYKVSSFAATMQTQTSGGNYAWNTAPSGTAGNAISFTQAMTLTASGRLLIGTPTEATYLLDVNGTGRFSGDLRITNNNWLVYTDSTATARNILTLASNDNLYLQYKAGSNFYLRNTDGDLRLTIASTGAATFSSSVTASGGSSSGFVLNYNANVDSRSWAILNDQVLYGDFQIQQSTTQTGGVRATKFYISPTGAATFSSSVTATSFFESSDSRLKTLIQDNYQTKGIASITPKLYTKNGKVELGYYAQDFIGILDSAVSKGSDDMLSLSYREVLVAKVYALEQRIKELENK